MYQHHIQDMAANLVEAGLVQDSQAAELAISQYWADKIAIVWTTADVHAMQDDFDEDGETSPLTEEQATVILQQAFDKHDAERGLSWEDLRFWSEEVCN